MNRNRILRNIQSTERTARQRVTLALCPRVAAFVLAVLAPLVAWYAPADAYETVGRVHWETNGIEGVRITGHDDGVAETDINGEYRYYSDQQFVSLTASFPPGHPHATYYTLVPDNTAETDFRFAGPTTTITGLVTKQDGTPANAALVSVSWLLGQPIRSVYTDTDGRYTIQIVSDWRDPFDGWIEVSYPGYNFNPAPLLANSQSPIEVNVVGQAGPPPPPPGFWVKGTVRFGIDVVAGARVEIWDSDNFTDDDRLATAWTNAEGYFQHTIRPYGDHWGGAQDVYLKIFFSNQAVTVKANHPTHGWVPVLYRHPFNTDESCEDRDFIDFGDIYIPTGGASTDYFNAFRNIPSLKDDVYALSNGSVNMAPLNVLVGLPNTSSSYNKSWNVFFVQPNFLGDEYQWAYFYSLAVLDQLGDTNPTSPQCALAAYIAPETVTDPNCAWEHGFGLFLSHVIAGPGWWDIESGSPVLVNNTHVQAASTAGNVAMTLWDLVDTPTETSANGQDNYDVAPQQIFSTLISTTNVFTLQSFWNAFGEKCATQQGSIGPVFAHNRLPDFNAAPVWQQLGDDPDNYTVFVDACQVVTTPPLVVIDDHCSPADLEPSFYGHAAWPEGTQLTYTWLPPSGSEPHWRLRITPGANCGTIFGNVSFKVRMSDGLKSSLSQWISYRWQDPNAPPKDDDWELDPVSGQPTDPNSPSVPEAFGLGAAYPNPFNPETVIPYAVPAPGGVVTIDVFDVQGRRVAELFNREQAAGNHSVVWLGKSDQGSPAASGTYFVRMTAPGFSEAKKIVLLK